MLVKPSGSVDKTFSIVLCILCLLKKHVCTVDLFFSQYAGKPLPSLRRGGFSFHTMDNPVVCTCTPALSAFPYQLFSLACCTGYFYMAVEGSGTRLHGTIIEKYKCNLSHTNIMNIHLLISIAGSWNNQI